MKTVPTGVEPLQSPPEEASIPRRVFQLAWPAITHRLLFTSVTMINRALLGHYALVALASMQLSIPILQSIYFVSTAFSMGTIAVVGRCVGSGDRREAGAAARSALVLAFGLGLVIALVGTFAPDALLRFVFPRADAALVAEAASYLRIVMPTHPLIFLRAIAAAALYGSGNTRTPMYVATSANVLNAAINVLFIFGLFGLPRLGVRGAAIGSAVAFSLEGVVLVGYLLSRRSPLPLRDGGPLIDRGALRRVLGVSWPTFIETALYQVGIVTFSSMIARLGTDVLAANQALTTIETISYVLAEGIGIAAASLVAQALGSRNPTRASKTSLIAAASSFGLLFAFAAVFASFPELFLKIFTKDPIIIVRGIGGLLVLAMAQPFMGIALVLSRALSGAGATRSTLYVNVFCALVVRLTATYLFCSVLHLGLVGACLGSTCDWFMRAGLFAILTWRSRWHSVRV